MTRREDLKSSEALAKKVLSDPSIYPDEFKAWIPRALMANVNFQVEPTQLPGVQSWRDVGVAGNAQFQNSWVNFGGANAVASYYKDPFGLVHLKGIVKSGTIPAVIFALPPGYRPQEAEVFAVASNSAFGVCTINPIDGTVVASAGSNVYFSISGITLRAFA